MSFCLYFSISWWNRIERGNENIQFNESILRELQRCQLLTSRKGVLERGDALAAPLEDGISPYLRDPLRTCSLIRDLVDFQAEIFNNEESVRTAATYVRERPEVLVNRIVSHILYVFNIQSIDGILPRLNQVYLFNEEMKNFLEAMRALLGAQNKQNAVIIHEIQRRVALSLSQN